MHRSSSRRNNDSSRHHRRNYAYSRNTTISTHPASGIYSSQDDTSGDTSSYSVTSYSKRVTVTRDSSSSPDSTTDDFEVDFPEVELKLPSHHPHHRHHQHRRCRRQQHGSSVAADAEQERRRVYEELPEQSSISHSSDRSRTLTNNSAVSSDYQSFDSRKRFQSIGNVFTSLYAFFQNNPNLTKIVLGLIFCYIVVCNLEILVPKAVSFVIRLVYPWARYSAVVCEQFFSGIANAFTRLDGVIHASYCDFAAKSCRSRRIMCDVTCSFVDHVLSQARPQVAPMPQN